MWGWVLRFGMVSVMLSLSIYLSLYVYDSGEARGAE